MGRHEEAIQVIVEYAGNVARVKSEAGRRDLFSNLLQRAFDDNPRRGADFSASFERGVTYEVGAAGIVRQGRVDAMLGSAIIEFKVDLEADRATARDEMRAYAAGLARDLKLDDIPFTGIATDGLTFERYRLWFREPGVASVDNVDLELCDSLRLSPTPESANDFFWFIHRTLLQGGDREPTPAAFQRDFGGKSVAFRTLSRLLGEAWALVKSDSDARLARGQWAKFLQFSYGEKVAEGKEGDRLYCTHTYLACLSKFMVWAAFVGETAGRDVSAVVRDVITGESFTRLGIQGAEDRDVFHWVLKPAASTVLKTGWTRLFSDLRAYDLRLLHADVLKVLYEELVDPKDRHDLGEYYTPDWLCAKVVEEMLPDEAFEYGVPSILDPACGSGSFLMAVIRRIKEALAEQHDPPDVAKLIMSRVMGFDIHPLAVTVARANYLLALGKSARHGYHRIVVPVYLADSMVEERVAPSGDETRPISFEGGVSIRIGEPPRPQVPVPPVDYDCFIDTAKLVAEEVEKGESMSDDALANVARRMMPDFRQAERVNLEQIVTSIRMLGTQMGELARQGQNTIWAFIARNFYRPLLAGSTGFDMVVGNPPWLSFRYVTNPKYKRKMEAFAVERYGVCSNLSSLRTQTELATTFLLHAAKYYTKRKTGRLAMVMPRSLFSADQHQKFREGPDGPDAKHFRVTKVWDLGDVTPLFNVPACVVFAKTSLRAKETREEIPGERMEGRLSQREAPRAEVEKRLHRKKTTWRLARMGKRSAWTDEATALQTSEPSHYAPLFFQGATIVPRNAFFVRVPGGLPKEMEAEVWVETDEEQARTAKEPWKALRFKGQVARRFIFKSALAKHLLPFATDGDLADVVLPLLLPSGKRAGTPRLLTSRRLRDEGQVLTARYFGEVEKAWEEHKKAAASERTTAVLDRIDYNKGATSQRFGKRYVVLYAASGTHPVAAWIDRRSLSSVFVTDHKTYRFETDNSDEAAYLCAVLNAAVVAKMVKPFQSRGLLGERDIHKKILDLPIPEFQPKRKAHATLAALGLRCAHAAEEARKTLKGKAIGARRTAVRLALTDELNRIDELVTALLGPNADA